MYIMSIAMAITVTTIMSCCSWFLMKINMTSRESAVDQWSLFMYQGRLQTLAQLHGFALLSPVRSPKSLGPEPRHHGHQCQRNINNTNDTLYHTSQLLGGILRCLTKFYTAITRETVTPTKSHKTIGCHIYFFNILCSWSLRSEKP